MWTRSQLKANAKEALKGRYWLALLVSFVAVLLGGGSGGSGGRASGASGVSAGSSFSSLSDELSSEMTEIILSVIPIIISVSVLAFLIGICYSVFVAAPIRVGANTYFMENRLGKPSFSRMFSGFSSRYKNLVLTVFMKNLFISLWSLLFVIPGIIKAYQYYYVEYIMAENPDLEWRRALELSKAMSDGDKWNIFVLELSFFGWYLLGALACCGVGVLFVHPYVSATNAELYETAREKALTNNLASPDELPGFILHA